MPFLRIAAGKYIGRHKSYCGHQTHNFEDHLAFQVRPMHEGRDACNPFEWSYKNLKFTESDFIAEKVCFNTLDALKGSADSFTSLKIIKKL